MRFPRRTEEVWGRVRPVRCVLMKFWLDQHFVQLSSFQALVSEAVLSGCPKAYEELAAPSLR
ncbi:MAG: hypothetical protein ACKERG_00025 [Candidatus Hodgkinia cicadicola]